MQISILGCGWLGLPLAINLTKIGHIIKGSTTTKEKFYSLESKNIIPFLIHLKHNEILGEINRFLENSELLIINLPPKLRSDQKESYVDKIKTLIPFIENHLIKQLIFVSSTSVYDDLEVEINENSSKNPATESGKQILEVENILKNNPNFNTLIIRFGGLINEERNPINQLSKLSEIEKPFAKVNLIHLNDCVQIITQLIEKNCYNEEFNVVSSDHSTRIDYYTQKAKERDLPNPVFNLNDLRKGKIILNDKIRSYLQFNEFTKL